MDTANRDGRRSGSSPTQRPGPQQRAHAPARRIFNGDRLEQDPPPRTTTPGPATPRSPALAASRPGSRPWAPSSSRPRRETRSALSLWAGWGLPGTAHPRVTAANDIERLRRIAEPPGTGLNPAGIAMLLNLEAIITGLHSRARQQLTRLAHPILSSPDSQGRRSRSCATR